MIETLLDGLFYAATSAVVSLSSREFKLYNLAAGAWIVVGGWLAAFLMGPWVHSPAPINPWYLLLLLIPAFLQVTSPLLLRESLFGNPLIYLLVSLGIALVVTTIGSIYLLRMSSATIPFDQGNGMLLVLITAAELTAIWYVMRSRGWAMTVLEFRFGESRSSLWRYLTKFLFVEFILLILLGAVGYQIHKGIFASAEYRTVIPLLAVMATRSNFASSAVLSFLVVTSSHLIESAGGELAGYSVPIAILFLGIFVLIRNWPVRGILQARKTESIPHREIESRSWSDQNVFGAAAFGILIVIFGYELGWLSDALHQTLFITALVALSWVAQRHLGVMSIAWPALGTLVIYATLLVKPNVFSLAVILVGGSVMWAVYLWCLRVLRVESALVVDLSLVVCLYQVVKKAVPISGDESVRVLSWAKALHLPAGIPVAMPSAIVILCLALVYFASRRPQLRALTIGVSSFPMGLLQGIPVFQIFMATATILAGGACLAVASYHVSQVGITPGGLALETGLMILLFGNLVERVGPALAFLVLFIFYGVLESVLAGHGMLLRGFVGLSLIALAFVPRLLRLLKW